MSLSDKISEDLKSAMKSGDQVRLSTVRSIRAQIIELNKRGTGSITEEDELKALLAASKKRKEAIEMYEKAGRTDLVKVETAELEIINGYLPKQMTAQEAEPVIVRIIQDQGAVGTKDFGKIMPLAMKELKGKIDGRVIQELVKSKLGG
ncbi:MAG: GatB/YqeY domain-containing protein [Ignavibacteriales bacterium]|nr:GatB/YqeY domain-containing protein [Ignavibacteriales bacterium]